MQRITDERCELIRKRFPEEHYPDDRPGRNPMPARKILEAVLWILNTGARWHMLPQSCPKYKTVHRRFQQRCESEVIRTALTELANALREEGEIDESECYIDATFASGKGGGVDQVVPSWPTATLQFGVSSPEKHQSFVHQAMVGQEGTR